MLTPLEEAFILASSKFKIPTLNYQQKLAIEKIVSNKKNVFVNLHTGFANLLFIKRFHLCLITPPTFRRRCQHCMEGENFRSVVHLEKRVRPDQRDDFESVIRQEPSGVLSAEIGVPSASESSWMTQEVQVISADRIWMLFLEAMKLMNF